MSYVAKNLLAGETITYSTRLHWKLFIVPILIAAVVLLPITYFALASQTKLWALLPLGLIAVALLPAYLRWISSEFAVTNKRVIMKVGVFTRNSYELFLNKVEGIAVNQQFLGVLFNYGSIVITGSGGMREPFSGIRGPLEFRRAVQSASDPTAPLQQVVHA